MLAQMVHLHRKIQDLKKKKNAFADLKSLAEILFKKSKECEDGSWALRPRDTILLTK